MIAATLASMFLISCVPQASAPAVAARRAELQREAEARLGQIRKSLLGSYERMGLKNAAWDDAARKALGELSIIWADVRDRGAAAPARVKARAYAAKAVEAGCDDPLLLYIHARLMPYVTDAEYHKVCDAYQRAGLRMKEVGSACSPIAKAYVYARAAGNPSGFRKPFPDEMRRSILAWYESALEAFGAAVRDREVDGKSLVVLGDDLVEVWRFATGDRKEGLDRVIAALEAGRPGEPAALILKGKLFVKYAWDGRGRGFAGTVPKGGFDLLEERLLIAEQALVKAWKLDPKDPAAPNEMLAVELGKSNGRAAMELWYRRALEADPDYLDACLKKQLWLEPKWHGSAEEVLEYSRELHREGNWAGRFPILLIQAHVALSRYEKDRPSYFRKPGVWPEIQAVAKDHFEHFPDAHLDRSWNAKMACWAGEWAEAHRQFGILGDQADLDAFQDQAELDRLRAEAARRAKEK